MKGVRTKGRKCQIAEIPLMAETNCFDLTHIPVEDYDRVRFRSGFGKKP